MRSAVGVSVSKNLKVMRFGDNMRQVAVTEGDKVEVQIKLGWQVNTSAVGDLVEVINAVTNEEVEKVYKEYEENYKISTDKIDSIKYQAKLEIAMQKMLDREGCGAYTNTFEDLHGMKQLPGLASQRLMAKGYGYGGEGDWKVSALTHIMKQMSDGLEGGTSFMEDYTYDLTKGNELSLGAHMLEVCPTLAVDKPKIEVHPLGIGGKEDPARLVFEGCAGVLVYSHGPFTWGTDSINAVHNAVVLEEIAFMAWHSLALQDKFHKPMQKELMDKHFFRKHGADAYYGQIK